ncbi:exported hypothetical protein [Xanthomonas citri pv. citri]|nr:exported hypothetical protein [Xanthomonas citri pv. citri]
MLGLMLVTLSAAPVSAGTLYKCVGADGITSYLSKRQSGATCSVISSYTPDRSARRPPSSPSAGRLAVSPAPGMANIDSGAPATMISQPASQPAAAACRRGRFGAGSACVDGVVRLGRHAASASSSQSAPGRQRAGVLLYEGRRAPLHQRPSAPGRQHRRPAHHPLQLYRNLLRLRCQARG